MTIRDVPLEPEPTGTDSDKQAESEALAVAQGTLERDADKNQHHRREKTRDHIGKAAVIGVWLAFLILALGACVWAWHMLAPEGWRYLTSEDIAKVQSLLSNIIIGAVLGFLVRNRFM